MMTRNYQIFGIFSDVNNIRYQVDFNRNTDHNNVIQCINMCVSVVRPRMFENVLDLGIVFVMFE
jgi:hypothetical protein